MWSHILPALTLLLGYVGGFVSAMNILSHRQQRDERHTDETE